MGVPLGNPCDIKVTCLPGCCVCLFKWVQLQRRVHRDARHSITALKIDHVFAGPFVRQIGIACGNGFDDAFVRVQEK